MTIVDVLRDPRFLSGQLWARSVLWREVGWAMRILPGKRIMLGYGATVNEAMDEHLDTYTSKWELVDPDKVIDAKLLANSLAA